MKRNSRYWQEVWRKKPDAMLANLNKINDSAKLKKREMLAQFRALRPITGDGPFSASELRDAILKAWAEVYGETLDKRLAWNKVRHAYDNGEVCYNGGDQTYRWSDYGATNTNKTGNG